MPEPPAQSFPLFEPPQAAVSLYPGDVMHARFKPKAHRFAYKVFTLLIDLDRLDEAHHQSRLFSVNRFNLLGFNERDHGGVGGTADGVSLSQHVRQLAIAAGVDLTGGRILLNAYPRLLGFVFNPLSVYYCYDSAGRLALLVYEVRNTFGEIHSYVAPVKPGEINEAGLRQARDKLFYVSPFIDMAQRYHFRIRPPGEALTIRILETDREGPILAATFSGKRQDMTSANVLKACLALPFMTLKVVAGIHWEALKLWLKGVKLVTRPAPPQPISFDAPGSIRQRPDYGAEEAPASATMTETAIKGHAA
ncbi:MAG: DUF1365 domain-containing protein [Bosea sp. (in: a-proteobacteria)]